MTRYILVIASVMWSGLSFGAVKYKCDGEWVDYWPCDAPQKADKLVEEILSQPDDSKRTIYFGSSPSNRLITATAEVESLHIDANDCDWALKVDKDLTKCEAVIRKTESGGINSQVLNELSKLSKDPVFERENKAEFLRLIRLEQEISKVVKLYWSRNR
ncbi:hypothetical protein D3C80_1293430 [compost metagenome]